MGDAGAAAVAVIVVAERAIEAAYVRRARCQPPEPVIGVGDALARRAVQACRKLEVAQVVGIIDVAGLGGGQRIRMRRRPLGHRLHRHPVERVVAIGERCIVAFAQGCAVAIGVVAIGFVIATRALAAVDGPAQRAGGGERARLGRVIVVRSSRRRGEHPADLPAMAVIDQIGAVAVAVDHRGDLAGEIIGPGRLRALDRRADADADLQPLVGQIVDIARDPVGAVGALRALRAGGGGWRSERRRVHPHRRAVEPAGRVVAILGQGVDRGRVAVAQALAKLAAHHIIGRVERPEDREPAPRRGRDRLGLKCGYDFHRGPRTTASDLDPRR